MLNIIVAHHAHKDANFTPITISKTKFNFQHMYKNSNLNSSQITHALKFNFKLIPIIHTYTCI